MALARLVLRINGHVVALGDDAQTSHMQTAKKVQGLLDSMQPPIVVCVGISAYNLVQELSLPWRPIVIAAQHTITWGPDYERTLAEQINGLLSGLAVNQGHMITTAQIS